MSSIAASSSETGLTAVILGATGAVGKPLLQTLLASPSYESVHSYLRRPSGVEHAKLKEHIIDFDKLLEQGADGEEDAKLAEAKADHVYITLGTTRGQAGSAAAFSKIDKDYVLAAARAAAVPSKSASNRVIYCSAQFASSSARFLYPRSKGETEEGLAAAGYADTIIFRPGFLGNADRPKSRPIETLYGLFTSKIASRFTDEAEIPVKNLARTMRFTGENGPAALTAAGLGSAPPASFKRAETAKGSVTILSNGEVKKLFASLEGK